MYGDHLGRLKKGQVWSYDLIVGSILFVIAMGVLAFFWWSARTNISENKDAIVREAVKVSDVLVSPGIPTNWSASVDPANVNTWAGLQQIGLAEDWDTNVLSVDKISKFMQMSLVDYSLLKTKLRSRYDFYMELTFYNDTSEEAVKMNGANITAGRQFDESTAKTIAKSDRVVIYNKSLVMMKVYMWSDSAWD